METKYLKINSADNVAVAITALPAGEKFIVDGKEIILNQGDSIYFNSKLPHGMKALDGKTVRFLAVIM